MFRDSGYYKKYNGSCFMYLCEILSKLQIFKVTNFMTFSDGLLNMCNFAYKAHTFFFFYFPLVIITNLKCNCACFMYVDEILRKLQFYEI